MKLKKLRKVPVILASTQTDMFAAEYRSDNSSGLHCRVIKIQHQTERLYSNILVQPTALITRAGKWLRKKPRFF